MKYYFEEGEVWGAFQVDKKIRISEATQQYYAHDVETMACYVIVLSRQYSNFSYSITPRFDLDGKVLQYKGEGSQLNNVELRKEIEKDKEEINKFNRAAYPDWK